METKGEDGVDQYLWGRDHEESVWQLWDGSLTNSSIHDAKLKKVRLPIEAGRERSDK